MLIICEGVDGSGKTTLVERLANLLEGNVRVLHRGPPTDHPLREYELDLQDYRPGSGEHVICDRWHLGELIYGPLYRGESLLEGAGQLHVEMLLQARGALLVHVDEPLDVVRERLATRGETYLRPEDVEWVWRQYDEVVYASHLETLDSSSSLASITGAAAHLERLAAELADHPTYVGPTRPTWLLLGERRGPKHPEFTSAFAPMPGTSGHYLLTHLPRTLRRKVGIANACEDGDLAHLHRVLGRPGTATLGQLATKTARAELPINVGIGAAPHPQYVRRFWHHHGEAYGQVIQEALRGRDLLQWRP